MTEKIGSITKLPVIYLMNITIVSGVSVVETREVVEAVDNIALEEILELIVIAGYIFGLKSKSSERFDAQVSFCTTRVILCYRTHK